MPYEELLHRLYQVNLFGGMKLGLQNVQKLQHLLGFPDRSYPTIHVAGTNGKGSVCTKIAYAFERAGYRAALYTSPHLSSFRERIRINGAMIPEKDVEELLERLFKIVEKENIPATFFELTTLVAFLYFSQQKADIAILETGLGGRLDATNIVHPCLSIITSISLDHAEILGSSRELIAMEKGGIIKEKVPVIIGPNVPLITVQKIALEKNSLCIQVKNDTSLFEEENRAIAKAALDYLASTFNLSPLSIQDGLEGKQPCRFELHKGPPLTILDVAHNPDGLSHLFKMIEHHYPDKTLRLLFGLSKNKDLKGCIKLIAQYGRHFHLVEAANGRGAPIRDLAQLLGEHSIDSSRLSLHESIESGVRDAQQEARQHNQLLLICGSFFIMGDARRALGIREPSDSIDMNERISSINDCADKSRSL